MNKKNNWNKIAGVFIQVKVSLKRSRGQSEAGGMGRGYGQVEEQTVEGSGPQLELVVRQGCERETTLYQSNEEEQWDGSDLTVVFQEAVAFL